MFQARPVALSREVLTNEVPLTAAERIALWKTKMIAWQLNRWYELSGGNDERERENRT